MILLKLTLSALGSAIALVSLSTAALAFPKIATIENGTVQVRRQESGVYIYGRSNMPLSPRDALLPSQGSRVTVACTEGAQPQRVTPGRLSGIQVICPDLARSFDGRNDDDLLQLLAGQFPYTPQVWRDPPVFTWPDVAPDATYQVTVTQVTFVESESSDPFAVPTPERQETRLHTATVTKNRWTYDGPLLMAAGRYQLQVETLEGMIYQVPFKMMEAEAAKQLAHQVQALADLEVAPTDQALALAYLYREDELNWSVISLLQPLVIQGTAPAAGHYLLAESYLQIGNSGLAAIHYGAAIALAQESSDSHTVAEAWVGLAKVAAVTQNRELTVRRLEAARQLYARLEVDEGWVMEIDEWLSAMAQEEKTEHAE